MIIVEMTHYRFHESAITAGSQVYISPRDARLFIGNESADQSASQ